MSLYDRDPALFGLIEELRQDLNKAGFQPPVLCSQQAFPLLLSSVPALRKTPGLATPEDLGKEYYTTIPFCRDSEGTVLSRAHLK